MMNPETSCRKERKQLALVFQPEKTKGATPIRRICQAGRIYGHTQPRTQALSRAPGLGTRLGHTPL